MNTIWRDQPVFVTGASGLLGAWMVEELVARGAKVVCLLRDWVPESRLIVEGLTQQGGATVVRGELEDLETLTRAVNEYEIQTVFHLGAQTIVGTAARSARSTFDSNIRGTWNLLEACRACGGMVKRIIVASSDKAYGEHANLPYTEATPLQGRYPYDVSKSCADLVAMSYYYTYQLPVAITRCGNLFGGGDLNFNRLIPGTIRSALLNERPIVRSDGTFVRDYFYIEDAVEAYLQLAERMPDDALTGQAFNFGTETPMSVLQVVEKILGAMGTQSLEPRILNEASHEIPRQYLDCSKARRVLGWQPQFSFEDALQRTIAWYRTWVEKRGPDASG